MTAKRPDYDTITRLVAEKEMPLKMGKEWLTHPFFDIPATEDIESQFEVTHDPDFRAYVNQYNENLYNPSHALVSMLEEGFYFDSFVARINSYILRYTKLDDATIEVILLSELKGFLPIRFKMTADGTAINYLFDVSDKRVKSMLERHPEAEKRFGGIGIYATFVLMWFRDFNNGKDRYMVKVEKEHKIRIKGIPSSREILRAAQGPRVIYLDRLPPDAIDVETGNPVGALREGHDRRGTWKTLRHPRYKYHPKYMQEKAIRVKPSWVGPRVARLQGNIYTILE